MSDYEILNRFSVLSYTCGSVSSLNNNIGWGLSWKCDKKETPIKMTSQAICQLKVNHFLQKVNRKTEQE